MLDATPPESPTDTPEETDDLLREGLIENGDERPIAERKTSDDRLRHIVGVTDVVLSLREQQIVVRFTLHPMDQDKHRSPLYHLFSRIESVTDVSRRSSGEISKRSMKVRVELLQ